MLKTWGPPDAPLSIEPIVVVEDYAVAGWVQSDRGGRALLHKKRGTWEVVLCSGEQLRFPATVAAVGASEDLARRLIERLLLAESGLSSDRLAKFSLFDGIVMMDSTHAAANPSPANNLLSATEKTGSGKTFKVGPLIIEAPWARATPAGAKVAGAYLKITNTGQQVDRLVGGSLPIAANVEVHEMTMADNVMKMRKLQDSLEIAPGQSVELKPGGYHLMLMGLKGGLIEGQSIKGTLTFEKAGSVEVEYRVAPIGAQAAGHSHH